MIAQNRAKADNKEAKEKQSKKKKERGEKREEKCFLAHLSDPSK